MDDIEIKFMKNQVGDDAKNLSEDPRFCTLAMCIIAQQDAGFRTEDGELIVDLRESECPDCKAPGYNTGWGYWSFSCGATVLTDGEPSEPCSKAKSLTP